MMQSDKSIESDPFPWGIGVFDAHCHPTDTMSSIDDIKAMKAATLTVMATREQDQELVSQIALQFKGSNQISEQDPETCNDRIIPCFGWHPWFSHQIFDDTKHDQPRDSEYLASIKTEHYKNVLTPLINDEELLNDLPAPFSLMELISKTKERLQRHPHALVGEIGLDKSFRIPKAWSSGGSEGNENNTASSDSSITPGTRGGRALSPYRVKMEHQRAVLKAQLRIAGELQRPVSLHSVQAHGAIIEVLQELWAGHEKIVISNRQRKRGSSVPRAHEGEDISPSTSTEGSESKKNINSKPFPPRICMHSYSGPVDPLTQFFHPKVPVDVYFSFSAVINFPDGPNTKSSSVISALPEEKILIESDLHCAGQRMDDLLEQIVRQVCDIRGWPLEKGTQILAENWKRFVFG
ncbi:hypothetical protein FQN49_007326 [Arthroderma sp. PD_2]|nr:hypothetical protein FQN49_007326 [Arthroderma sp. PD_2]